MSAEAVLINSAGRPVGTATFWQTTDGAVITVRVRDLPLGRHGIHLHRHAQCDPPEFLSAGAHFNPEGKKHGRKNPEGHHLGDLPNLEVADDGTGRLAATVPGMELVEFTPTAIANTTGLAVIIHERQDDEVTDPDGNSGARIACGTIHKTP